MMKPTFVLLSFFALSLEPHEPLRAQATTALTARDRIEINQLAARYAFALDTRADNGMAFADLFAPEGEFVGSADRRRGGTSSPSSLATASSRPSSLLSACRTSA